MLTQLSAWSLLTGTDNLLNICNIYIFVTYTWRSMFRNIRLVKTESSTMCSFFARSLKFSLSLSESSLHRLLSSGFLSLKVSLFMSPCKQYSKSQKFWNIQTHSNTKLYTLKHIAKLISNCIKIKIYTRSGTAGSEKELFLVSYSNLFKLRSEVFSNNYTSKFNFKQYGDSF